MTSVESLVQTVSRLEQTMASVLTAVNTLSDRQILTGDEITQLRMDFDSLHDAIPVNANVFLKPSELADLLKVSTSTVTKYRNEGRFKKSSIKEVVRGKRTDFYYHRINAVKDLSSIKPILINSGKKILDQFQ